MPRVTNPYIAGPALTAEMPFFGREDVFRFVRERLSSPHQNVLVLFGQRRIGKTSLLHHLPAHLPEGFHAVYYDLMGKAGQPLPEVLHDLACTVARDLNLPKPGKADFHDSPSFRDRFLPQVNETLGDKRLLLLFDEFDVLGDEPPPPEAAARTLIPYLMGLIQDQRQVAFVFVVGRRLEELPSRFKPLFKGVPYKRVSLLEYEDAVALIREPAMDTLAYTGDAIDRILHLTACHPYLTQLICFELFSAMQRAGRDTVTVADVDAVIDRAIEQGTGGLTWFWDGFRPAERFVLSAVAAAADESGVTTFTKLQDVLHEQGIYLGDVDLNETLGVLVEWEILRSPTDGSYCFTVEIVRRWMQAAHPLEQARSDIDYIVERAVRHFQSARDAHLYGDLEFAVEEYRRALAANPNYAQAQLGLAQALYELDRLEEAASEYEKAFSLDEARARNGLIDSYRWLAELHERKSNWKAAGNVYKKLRDLDPAKEEWQEALAKVRRMNRRAHLKRTLLASGGMILLVILFLLSIQRAINQPALVTPTPTPIHFVPYVDPQAGFAIEYPEGWKPTKEPKEPGDYSMVTFKGSNGAKFTVYYKPLPPRPVPNLNFSSEILFDTLLSTNVVSAPENIVFKGESALAYQIGPERPSVRLEVISMVRCGSAFALVCQSSVEDWEHSMKHFFEPMLNSFQWEDSLCPESSIPSTQVVMTRAAPIASLEESER